MFCWLLFSIAFSMSIKAQLPAYELPKPAGWQTETFPLPPAFAKEITFIGTEDIRFAPGWAKSGSDQYWAYAFVWLIQGNKQINAQLLKYYLTAYYNGLYATNTHGKPALTAVTLLQTKSPGGDQQTFEGKVQTLNYMNQQPLGLQVRIHIKTYPKQTASALLFEVSPQAFTHPVWKELKNITDGFRLTTGK